MTTITLENLLPAMVTATAALALLWLLFWIATLAVRRWSGPRSTDGNAASIETLAQRLTHFLKRVTGLASLVIAILIMMHGLGINGLPRLTWNHLAEWVRGSGLPLLFIFGSALVLIRATGMVTRSLPDLLLPTTLSMSERMERRKRIETRGRLLRWSITTVVLGVAAYVTLQSLGLDVTPLLAGGAIFSVALGFGAQNLVRDVLGGLFLIIEDQLRIGDYATVNGKTGEIEAIHLRTTRLRDLDGTVHIFSNGQINELSNLTKDYSYFVLDLGVAYKENVDRVMDVLRDVGRTLREDPVFGPATLAPLDVMGLTDFAASAVVIKMRIMTVPLQQWAVGRELRRLIKNRFDAEGIELPYPHMTLYMGETAASPRTDMDGADHRRPAG